MNGSAKSKHRLPLAPGQRAALLLAAVVLTASASYGANDKPPVLSVRARTQLSSLVLSPRGRQVKITGQLRNNLNVGVPEAHVIVSASGAPRVRSKTDGQGRFSVVLKFETDGKRRVEVRFDGSEFLAPSRRTGPVDVGRLPVKLRIEGPRQITAGEPVRFTVRVSAGPAEALPGLQIESRLDGKVLVLGTSDSRGLVSLKLGSLAPGTHRLEARFEGGPDFEPAQTRLDFEATQPLQVSLKVATAEISAERSIVLEGQVTGGDGVWVSLSTKEGALGRRPVDAEGRFSFTLQPAALPVGTVSFRAEAYSAGAGWQDAASGWVVVEIPAPTPLSALWFWAPALLCAALLIGLAFKRPRRRPPPVRSEQADPSAVLPPVVEFELTRGRPRGPLEVLVHDALTRAPVTEALVARLPVGCKAPNDTDCVPPEGAAESTDAAGRVTIEAVGDRLWAWAPGYAPTWRAVPANATKAVIHLPPIRARIQTLYAQLLRDAGRPRLIWGKQTPSEAQAPLQLRGASQTEIEQLTALVERACFGAQQPDLSQLGQIARLAGRVRAGLARS